MTSKFEKEIPTNNKKKLHSVKFASWPKRILSIFIGISSILLIWFLVSLSLPQYILPGPKTVGYTFFDLIKNGDLLANLMETTLVTILGLFFAAISAGIFAILFVLYEPVEAIVYPIVVALRSVPAVAIAPLLVIWTGTSLRMKILVSAFVSFFPILVYVLHGLRGPNQEYLDQFEIWAANKNKILWKLRIPWAIPSFFAALKVAVTYALIGSFISELMGSQRGLGRMVISAYYHLDTPIVIVGIICFAFLGIVLFALSTFLEKLILKKIPVLS